LGRDLFGLRPESDDVGPVHSHAGPPQSCRRTVDVHCHLQMARHAGAHHPIIRADGQSLEKA